MSGPRVLHVLPHAGAGAQTYLDVLDGLDGYEFEIFELSASRSGGGAAASIAGRLPALARASREADLVHVHGEVASLISLPALVARPSVVTLHGLHLLRRLRPGAPSRLGRAGVASIVAAAGATICVSHAEADELGWLPPRLLAKLVVIRNGLPAVMRVDPQERANARAVLGLADDAVAILYAGQLEPRKDPLTAVRATRIARRSDPRIVLLVAGDGPLADELESMRDEGVRPLGQRRDVDRLLAAADVFVMPSHREGLSYAVLEALGHGVATVVSDGPGNPEAVGDAGLVFEVADEDRLAQLLAQLAGDPQRRAELGAAGRARVSAELAAGAMRDGTRAVYARVLRAPGRRAGAPRA
jgi:glycosyltransferase involved in cell wall biosynthesis